jgi:ABC-type nitrate/sulfonate/bicarbonate transport system substrate-binding protein
MRYVIALPILIVLASAVVLISATAVCFTGLGSPEAAFAQSKLEVAEVDAWLVRDPQMSSQFAVADQMGYFKEEGLKVTPRWYIAGTDLPSMWGAGNIHLGTATATMVVPIAAAGQAIYNIAPQSDVAGTQQVVLGKKGQEIVRAPKDLEKVKIGMPKGASITMAIQKMAKETGVDFEKIQFVNLAPPDAVTALAKGDIDAMAAWAPWVFNAVKQAGGKVYFSGNRSHIPGKEGEVEWLLVHAGVVASGKMLKDNPNTLKAILRALNRATATINSNRDAAVKIVAKEMKLEEAQARDIMTLNVYSMEMTDKIYRGMGEFVDFLHALNRIPQKISPEGVFYTKLLEEVDPKLVKWKSKTEVK